MKVFSFGTAFAAVATLALSAGSVDAQSTQSNGLFGKKDPNQVLDDRYKRDNNRNQNNANKKRQTNDSRTRSTRTQRGSFF